VRACTDAEPKPDEAMSDAPKLRKAKGGKRKKQPGAAAAAPRGAGDQPELAAAEAMQQ
jgi:hypothetical protein